MEPTYSLRKRKAPNVTRNSRASKLPTALAEPCATSDTPWATSDEGAVNVSQQQPNTLAVASLSSDQPLVVQPATPLQTQQIEGQARGRRAPRAAASALQRGTGPPPSVPVPPHALLGVSPAPPVGLAPAAALCAALAGGEAAAQQRVLTQELMAAAVDHLTAADPVLAPLIAEHGPPERLLAKGAAGCFSTLAKSIVYQQLSIKAAGSIYTRLLAACGCEEQLTHASVLAAQHEALRSCGLSHQKAAYIRSLAEHFSLGQLSDEVIARLDGDALVRELTKVKGIGRWSADMFAMFHLGHTDILPLGDLGVRRGMGALYNLKDTSDVAKLEAIAEAWRPYRSIGAYYMWRVPPPPQQRGGKHGGGRKAKAGG